jgi:RNA polymerase sigma-70 factor, ECF subfamily
VNLVVQDRRVTDVAADLDRVLAGDREAFQALVTATSARLVRVSARILGNLADAEDVVQECYVKAYRALVAGEFDGRSSVATWLYRIVVNGALDAARRTRADRRAAAAERDARDDAWDGGVEAHLALKELDAWLGLLPPDQRAALVLKTMEGLSSAEIGDVLGCSEGAVEQRLVRARAALREKREAP